MNVLETLKLILRKGMVQRVTIVKTRVNERCGYSGSCFEVEGVTNTTKISNVIVAGAG